MDKEKHGALDAIMRKQVKAYNRRKAKVFFDMAVGEMLDTHGIKETKAILSSYLESLEEFG